MQPNFKPIQSATLPESIAEQIMGMIAAGQIKPGDRLPTEPELMERFGVGRSTVREAIKSLTLAGLVEARRSAGTFVSDNYTGFLSDQLKWSVIFGDQELRHIVEVRGILEGQTAALAAKRATPEQKKQLAQVYAALIDAQDPKTAADHDMAFHVLIAEASNNPLLLSLMLSIRRLIQEYITRTYAQWRAYDQADRDENVMEHRPILTAIQAGKPQAARKAMLDHLDASARWMLDIAKARGTST